jgi:hypothetical protein
MEVVVIGGSGLIGSKVVAKLTEHGHEAIAASPQTGVNTLTGEGLDEVLTGAQVVVGTERPLASGYFRAKSAQEKLIAEGAVARTALGQPVGGILEVAGPDRHPLDDHTLVPATSATVFPTRFEDWLLDNTPAPVR